MSEQAAGSPRGPSGADRPSSIDPAWFRTVLGHSPTPVTVVTAATPSGPTGLTIGSFTSVSLDPPLVGFLPGKESDSWPGIREAGAFCVNVLRSDQADLCWRFARDELGERFDGVDWRPGPTGSPILAGAVAWIDCTIEAVHEAGDHWFVVGRVVALDHAPDVGDEPLVFCRGRLGHFAGPS